MRILIRCLDGQARLVHALPSDTLEDVLHKLLPPNWSLFTEVTRNGVILDQSKSLIHHKLEQDHVLHVQGGPRRKGAQQRKRFKKQLMQLIQNEKVQGQEGFFDNIDVIIRARAQEELAAAGSSLAAPPAAAAAEGPSPAAPPAVVAAAAPQAVVAAASSHSPPPASAAPAVPQGASGTVGTEGGETEGPVAPYTPTSPAGEEDVIMEEAARVIQHASPISPPETPDWSP